MEHDMPANTQDAAHPVRSHRWLATAVKTASEPLPTLPFDRANRSRPTLFVPTTPARSASVAAR
jgi:hypothetical protein